MYKEVSLDTHACSYICICIAQTLSHDIAVNECQPIYTMPQLGTQEPMGLKQCHFPFLWMITLFCAQ